MPEPFKNIFNEKFIGKLTDISQEVIPDFNGVGFFKSIFDATWKEKELKARMRHIAIALENHLPGDYKQQVHLILKIINQIKKHGLKQEVIEFMIFPDFVEVYGLEHFKVSIKAMEKITQFTSCEFAIRPYILKYPKATLKQMLNWSGHKHPMVRRLATEGCRPRLPWAVAIPDFKKDPTPVLPILEKLKNDPSEDVRRSVANNLNDISKDNPDVVIRLTKKWQGKSEETDKLLKHACRTLLKQGNPEVLGLFGLGSVKNIEIENFQVLTPKVKIGDALEFSFNLQNNNTTASKIRLEYGLYYQKANGSLSKKVFKISEKDYPEKSVTTVHRKQSFRVITTRKYHPGMHQVSIITNGKEFERKDFELI